MSRAYCLTCNEPVHEAPSGTCPLGHPVTTHDHGPEPWVGFAGDEDRAAAGTATPARVPLERLDVDGRPAVPAGRANGAVNGHANGHGPALGGGQGHADPFPSAFGHRSSFAAFEEPSAPPTERAPATGAAADDLAALLADALSGGEESWEAPVDHDREDAATSGSDDTDDLTALAAELQLGSTPRDDGPAAAAVPDLDHAAIDTASIDDLLAELTGGLAADDDAPADLLPPPAAATVAPLPPPPPPAATEAPLPPPPAPGATAPEPVDHVPATWEDLASPPPAPEPVDPWAEPTPDPAAPAATEASVDLTNFTARGKRVGEAGAGRPRKRGRKR